MVLQVVECKTQKACAGDERVKKGSFPAAGRGSSGVISKAVPSPREGSMGVLSRSLYIIVQKHTLGTGTFLSKKERWQTHLWAYLAHGS
jgi:hypothetical protein